MMRGKSIYLFIIILSLSIGFFLAYSNRYYLDKPISFNKHNTSQKRNKTAQSKDNIVSITLSAAGDCTIGYDTNFGYGNRFDKVFKDVGNDYSYFFRNVKDIFDKDDITYVNLEGTFTNETVKVEKRFNFKSTPDFVNVLKEGSIEIVGVANNHSYDYGNKGFEETIDTLNKNSVEYFGYDKYLIKEIKGIKIGFFGLIDIANKKYSDIDKAINYLKEQNCDLIIAAIHWGDEGYLNQNNGQIKQAHYMIDNGVDLVIGTHPHVIQGIEKYKDKYILYSLANFVFGGNPNPKDKDTYIFQQTFKFKNKDLIIDDNINIVPTMVSGTKNKNNYQPTIATGADKERIINKINKYSINFEIK